MIILYQIPEDATAKRLRKILEKENIEHMYVTKELAGQTIGDLFAGVKDAKPCEDPTLPEDPTVVFNGKDNSNEEAGKLLDKFFDNDIVFGFPVYASDDLMKLPLGDVLVAQRNYQEFLQKLSFLQQMIDGCASLKPESYDPDKWSNLKIAIADANDFLDAVVNDSEGNLDKIEPRDADKILGNLQEAMKNLLS